MIKLIIFDLWKTLGYRDIPYDSDSAMSGLTRGKVSKKEFVKIFENSLQTKKWRSKYRAYTNLCRNMRLPVNDQNVKKLINIRDGAETKIKLFPYTITLLKQLKKLGYQTGLISNSSVFAVEYLKKMKLLDLIDYPLFSFQVGVIKPDLKIYKKLLIIAKCKPAEAIMIGDKIGDDVIPPRKIGMYATHFTNYLKLKKDFKKFNIFIR